MSAVTEKYLVCDLCGSTTRDGNLTYPSIKALREDAVVSGWLRKEGKDICWDCTKKKFE